MFKFFLSGHASSNFFGMAAMRAIVAWLTAATAAAAANLDVELAEVELSSLTNEGHLKSAERVHEVNNSIYLMITGVVQFDSTDFDQKPSKRWSIFKFFSGGVPEFVGQFPLCIFDIFVAMIYTYLYT